MSHAPFAAPIITLLTLTTCALGLCLSQVPSPTSSVTTDRFSDDYEQEECLPKYEPKGQAVVFHPRFGIVPSPEPGPVDIEDVREGISYRTPGTLRERQMKRESPSYAVTIGLPSESPPKYEDAMKRAGSSSRRT